MKEQYARWNDIWQKIKAAESIAIFRHINPDLDAYGSQFALAHLIADHFPKKRVFCYGELVERLHKVYDSGAAFYDDVPSELSDTLIISVDTANIDRLDQGPLPNKPTVDIKIDHHPNIDHYAARELVNVDTPATCALLLDCFLFFVKNDEDFIINKIVYEKLYAGIVGDTGNFSYGNGLNEHFFANVGVIFENVDTKKLLHQFFARTLNEVKFAGALSQRIQQEEAFAYVAFDSDFVASFDVSLDYATSLVSTMRDIIGVRIWASFCEDKTQQLIRCSLRSRYLDVSAVAATFGGGGHKNAAGVRLQTWDEVAALKVALKNLSMQGD